MTPFLERLAARRRFGMKPGLDAIARLLHALGDPHLRVRAVHVAGTNGKGAVCAMVDSCLRAAGLRTFRYTSPHLVRINERFMLDGAPAADSVLDEAAAEVERAASAVPDLTFFEALTAVAFLVADTSGVDVAVLETGLGGRLDATNVCSSVATAITRIGLDHCDWLGDTVEKIAAEKAGIVKTGVPVVLGRNVPEVVEIVKGKAAELGSPFVYAPDAADERDLPPGFALGGSFNRENAVTALALMKALPADLRPDGAAIGRGLADVVWPGRFQRVGRFIVDGAHNPPAAQALVSALAQSPNPIISQSHNPKIPQFHNSPLPHPPIAQSPNPIIPQSHNSIISQFHNFPIPTPLTLIAGFCGDKDVREVLRILKPVVGRAIAVRTNNPRSLPAEELAAMMREEGIAAVAAASLPEAIAMSGDDPTLICGSLFLAGEALVALGAYPYSADRFDPSEQLRQTTCTSH
ncbi:MAG: bifunctional folylpolyglutamate synthase/dihydrofolate synthase [Kiritimatiellae bacterium]|nr:bifunctional folylpolyglutamate synthase/dihydrofolate synthase [Kiritimatiellia bacterium]